MGFEVPGHGEGHTDERTFGGGIRNLTRLSFKLRRGRENDLLSKGGEKKVSHGIPTHSSRTRYHDNYTPLAIRVFRRNRNQILASNSREVECPRQIDVHSKVPYVERMGLSVGAYDLDWPVSTCKQISIREMKRLAHLCCRPNTSTVDDAS